MDDQITDLSHASFGGNAELVASLLRAGASATARDSTGLTSLHRAAIGGHAAIVSALLASTGAGVREAVNVRDAVRWAARALAAPRRAAPREGAAP